MIDILLIYVPMYVADEECRQRTELRGASAASCKTGTDEELSGQGLLLQIGRLVYFKFQV